MIRGLASESALRPEDSNKVFEGLVCFYLKFCGDGSKVQHRSIRRCYLPRRLNGRFEYARELKQEQAANNQAHTLEIPAKGPARLR
jgi:hypothetical protein